MSAATHWGVIAVLGTGQGIGTCPHEHATADEATMCTWTPDPWPRVCDLLVRQFRTGPVLTKPRRLMEARQQVLRLDVPVVAANVEREGRPTYDHRQLELGRRAA